MEFSECEDLVLNKNYADSTILLEINTLGVASIILNRPEKHNSLDNKMVLGLNNVLDDLYDYIAEKKYVIKILLLKARGKSFCAGADLKHMQEMVNYTYDENYNDAMELAQALSKLANFPCPSMSIVNGSAYGGGVGLICCTDFAYAIKDAEFCLSEVKLGLIPAVISPYIVNTCGLKKSKKIILSACKFNAQKALEYDILSGLAESYDDLVNIINQLVTDLLSNGPIAMIEAKKMINNYAHSPDVIDKTVEAIARIRISQEGQEGLLAFLSKKKPSWVVI